MPAARVRSTSNEQGRRERARQRRFAVVEGADDFQARRQRLLLLRLGVDPHGPPVVTRHELPGPRRHGRGPPLLGRRCGTGRADGRRRGRGVSERLEVRRFHVEGARRLAAFCCDDHELSPIEHRSVDDAAAAVQRRGGDEALELDGRTDGEAVRVGGHLRGSPSMHSRVNFLTCSNWGQRQWPMMVEPLDVVIPTVTKDYPTLGECVTSIFRYVADVRFVWLVSKERPPLADLAAAHAARVRPRAPSAGPRRRSTSTSPKPTRSRRPSRSTSRQGWFKEATLMPRALSAALHELPRGLRHELAAGHEDRSAAIVLVA